MKMLRATLFPAVQALLLLHYAELLSALPTTDDKVLRIPLRRDAIEGPRSFSQPRDVSASLKNARSQYLIDLKVGSNNQPITFSLDTGSTDVWMFSSSACDRCQGGTYNPSTSKTRKDDKDIGPLDAEYLDGTSAKGYFVKDQAMLGSSKIDEVYFGVATENHGFSQGYSVMGIGPKGLESSKKDYDTFVDSLHKSKVISSKSYSIYLNKLSASGGSITFGGVDKTKYSGSLVALDIVAPQGTDKTPRLQVWWNSLAVVNSAGGTANLRGSTVSTPAVLDTGKTISTLPLQLFYQVYSYLGGTDTNKGSDGFYRISCNPPHKDESLVFGFGPGTTVKIKVPFSELILPNGNSPQCLFGLEPGLGGQQTFGDTFLRSAYMYVDFDKSKISLAQSVWS